MAKSGNANTKTQSSKRTRTAKIRKRLQLQLEEGTIELLAFQQAVGGSIMNNEKAVTDVDHDDVPFDVSRRGKEYEEIIVPDLEDIVAPVPQVPAQIPTESLSQQSKQTP